MDPRWTQFIPTPMDQGPYINSANHLIFGPQHSSIDYGDLGSAQGQMSPEDYVKAQQAVQSYQADPSAYQKSIYDRSVQALQARGQAIPDLRAKEEQAQLQGYNGAVMGGQWDAARALTAADWQGANTYAEALFKASGGTWITDPQGNPVVNPTPGQWPTNWAPGSKNEQGMVTHQVAYGAPGIGAFQTGGLRDPSTSMNIALQAQGLPGIMPGAAIGGGGSVQAYQQPVQQIQAPASVPQYQQTQYPQQQQQAQAAGYSVMANGQPAFDAVPNTTSPYQPGMEGKFGSSPTTPSTVIPEGWWGKGWSGQTQPNYAAANVPAGTLR
jgi:hypothetical protein